MALLSGRQEGKIEEKLQRECFMCGHAIGHNPVFFGQPAKGLVEMPELPAHRDCLVLSSGLLRAGVEKRYLQCIADLVDVSRDRQVGIHL